MTAATRLKLPRFTSELGWQPRQSLETGLRETVRWYLDHPEWVQAVAQQPDYQGWIQKNYTNRAEGVK